VACWSTKAAISLKRVKIEEKLLWRAYRKSQTLFRTVPSSTVGAVRTLEIFQGTHILGASRDRLCDSSAFLFELVKVKVEVVYMEPHLTATVSLAMDHMLSSTGPPDT